ncbi:hypothetical protein AB0M13_09805 [Nocardia fluminea]|uniref:hypothetical protein n=1 Tax=Nocardia fluminea TaxID=134984 RepID=UPI00342D024C
MSGGVFRAPHEDRNQIGRSALGSMSRPEFAGIGAVYAPVNHLPPALRLVVLAVCVLIGMVGCSVAWVDQQSYVESPNICRAHEVERTDCVHVKRIQPTRVP